MLKIGIINGPNLNMLGKRNQKVYGNLSNLILKERLLNLLSSFLPVWMV